MAPPLRPRGDRQATAACMMDGWGCSRAKSQVARRKVLMFPAQLRHAQDEVHVDGWTGANRAGASETQLANS